jgi:nicotinic acid mononucleotide adenylyltransferase
MKTCHFTFGRFNPPTIGHEKLIKAVANAAGSGDYLIYPSQSFKKPDNPLPYDYKVEIMKKMFPWAKIESAACCNTIMKVAQDMMMKEYTDIVMVVGSDRVADFDKLLQKQNRIDYSFSTIKVISAGERDPDAAGASGMSASKMRDAAKNLKTSDFLKGIPDTLSSKEKMELMAKVRSGMGL